MGVLNQPYVNGWIKRSVWTAIAISIIALILSALTLFLPRSTVPVGKQGPSKFQEIVKHGVIRVGYGGFPPYTVIDPKETDPSKRVKGFSVDLVNEIAKRMTPPVRVEWVLLNWETIKADMLSGKFDFIADPVFQTIPRAMDLGLCDPYSLFGIAVALVKKDESRFKKFEDLDRSDITISLAEGWTSTEYAEQVLKKPKLKRIPVTGDAFVQLDEVLLGRADVALNDVPTVAQYARAHSDKVKALWLDDPPSSVVGSFMTRKSDDDLREFLNGALRVLIADGTLKRLDEKWKTFGYLPQFKFSPGAGLQGAK